MNLQRLFPHPWQGSFLLLMWLLLAPSISVATVLAGGLVALAGMHVVRPLDLPPVRVRRPLAMLRLLGRVLPDIVASNVAVAGIILGPKRAERRAGFMDIPLQLTSPYGLMMLAVIITATPGTLWVNFNSTTRRLTIHVLDLQDEQAWIDTIQGRYESLLREIFQ